MQQLSAAKRGGVTRRPPAPHSRHPIHRTPGLEAVDRTRAQPSREASSHRVQQAIGMNPTAVTKRTQHGTGARSGQGVGIPVAARHEWDHAGPGAPGGHFLDGTRRARRMTRLSSHGRRRQHASHTPHPACRDPLFFAHPSDAERVLATAQWRAASPPADDRHRRRQPSAPSGQP